MLPLDDIMGKNEADMNRCGGGGVDNKNTAIYIGIYGISRSGLLEEAGLVYLWS